jgi:hypothetical protein
MTNDHTRKKPSKQDRKNLKDLVEMGVVTPNRPGNPRKGYSVRAVPEDSFEQSTYPGFADHPTTQGIEYAKHVDLNGTSTVWEAIQNDNYASGGMPTWIWENTSEADISLYWQMVHYQRVWDGIVKVSVRTLSRNVSIQYRSVQRCIKNLQRVGLIVMVAPSQGRKPNQYRVQLPSSIPPKVFEFKRRESGFLEVTAESVEVTAENSKGNHADTQKTKPLKGLVSEDRAEARLANTNKKTISTSDSSKKLKTIDEETKARKKKINLEKARERKSLAIKFRAYHEHEVAIPVLEYHLETCPPLRKLFDACLDISKTSGGVDEATGEIFAYWDDARKELLSKIQSVLTNSQFNTNNLDRAIELTLERVHKGLVSLAAQVQDKKATWERNVRAIQERKEWEEKQEKAQALALADAEALAIASAIAIEATREEEKLRSISILNDCKQRIRSQLPRFERDISDFGFQTAIKKINKNIDEYSYLFLVYEELAKAFGRESLEKENIRLELWWTAEPEILFSLAWGAGSS